MTAVYRSLGELPLSLGPTVATIGNFDGVHRGHRWVIGNVLNRARELGVASLVITFDPHPSRALRPELSRPMISPLPQKLELLASTGVDAVVVLPFTEELSKTSARDFASGVLRRGLQAVELHEGENFRLGYGAEAGVDTLADLGRELGFAVHSYPQQTLVGGAMSSSRIRDVILAGDVSTARRLLGRPFAVKSTPASGRGYGTRYTVPTINLAPYAELLPSNGVYVTAMRVGVGVGARVFDGVTNVGNRPTFGADSFTVETHLLNFEPMELLEETPLELCFFRRIRAEMRWPTPEDLKAQIGRDVRLAQRFFRLARAMRALPPA